MQLVKAVNFVIYASVQVSCWYMCGCIFVYEVVLCPQRANLFNLPWRANPQKEEHANETAGFVQ